MKNFNKSSFVTGVLASALVFGLASPVTASWSKTAQLVYNNIHVRLNGDRLNMTDANGTAVEPFIIDGTTYLPVRAVGEALGLDVGWEQASSTVTLDTPNAEEPSMWLGEMESFTGNHYFTERIEGNDNYMHDYLQANDGTKYDNYYHTVFEADYLLNGEYSTFEGTVYLPLARKNDDYWQRRYVVLLDNKVVYTSDGFSEGVYPEDFSINVTGAQKMTIKQECDDIGKGGEEWEPSNGSVYIGNAALWR